MLQRPSIIALLALLLSLPLSVQAASAQSFIVAHSATGSSPMSRGDIRRMYLNQKPKWPSGQRVRLAIMAHGPARDHLLQRYIGKNSARFDRYWKRQLFTGRGIPPETFTSQTEMLEYVRTTPGAIACYEGPTPPPALRIILVQD
ncbi:MAG: hypothetical protein ABFR97_02265 [Thermodesulfobacteriota bacterium]